ncbi:MAG: GDP-mannose 4,6-dehydratase [Candidatus Omnitrophica bacterium]|nr:GDP-mannose 4,6-dehydratase [Candidatus Omnitrophota bacterium]MCM8776832.1 GDP-mannose 4,6-dehydratase [Candidatus Omnitrophota bacterium]
MKKILLTGCGGFIGSKVGELLLERGFSVVGIDDMNDYYDVRLKEWRLAHLIKYKNFSFTKQDISSHNIKKVIVDFSPDSIINLAARAGVRASIKDPFIYFKANLEGTLNLLEIAKEIGIKKFILASSSSVYAGEDMPFNEELPVNRPISPYAASKKSAECLCYTYHYLYNIDITVYRFFTVYGPAGRPDMSVFKFIKLIDEGVPLTIFGDGSQKRDFTYVDDIAEGTIRGLDISGFNIINLGGNHPYSINELVSLIEKELGKKAVINYKNFEKTDLVATWADIEKAKRLLNWQPLKGLPEGIRKTVQWYKENRHWIKDIKLVD